MKVHVSLNLASK